jgi:dipeptidyl aminopeptidase/acylaminoacyl peptidase
MSTRSLIFTLCLTLFCSFLIHSSVLGQKQLAPLPIKDAFKTHNFPMFEKIDLSPDGRLVAYTLQDANRKAQSTVFRSLLDLQRIGIPRGVDFCDIWIADIATGNARNLTQGRGTNWSPAWSPNGNLLAFYSDREGTPALWIWERASGILRKASDAIVRTRAETFVPRWTPDSKKLVIRVLTNGVTLAEAGALLDKPRIAYSANTAKEPGSSVVLFSSKASEEADKERERGRTDDNLAALATDLVVVDLEIKKTRRIASRIPTEDYWVSPDGTNLAVLIHKGRQSHQNLQAFFDIAVISLVNGTSRILVSNFGSDILIPVSWSPDGKLLAYMTIGPAVKNDCWVVPVSGGEPRNVTKGEHPVFDSTILYRGPLWDAASENIYLLSKSSLWRASLRNDNSTQIATIAGRTLRHILSHNGRTIWTPTPGGSVVVVTRDADNKEGFYKINLNTGTPEKLLEEDKSYGFVPSLRTAISPDGHHLIYTSQSATEPEDIWTTEMPQFHPRRLTHTNPIFDRYVMGESRRIEWQTLNGQTARGALLLPAGYTPGTRYPLIVYQYPGSTWSTYGNQFGFSVFASAVENWQFFATRGYAVLMPDVPARPETYMKDIAAAVLPAVDKVIELGICDPERIGVTGQSNGGYGVLSLIVQTNRFKAAVDRMGPGNLISQYTQMSENGTSVYTGEMVQRTGGSLWEKREKFIENSPIFYFDRVHTPLLIIQGTADQQVMAARSDEVFVSLRFLGKEVEYARYAGEPHGVSEWSFPNQVDYLNRVIAWFDRWLKAKS